MRTSLGLHLRAAVFAFAASLGLPPERSAIARALKRGRVWRWGWEVGNQAGECAQHKAFYNLSQSCVH